MENYNLTINTSMRSHGKWGDFLVATIPLSWCGNILINSNFILRMLEWQNESSLFVIRIQGKQWYWAYKYNADTNYRLNNTFINVGNNNWLKSNTLSIHNFNYNNTLLSFIYDYEFKKIHRNLLIKSSLSKQLLKKFSLSLNLQKYIKHTTINKYLNTNLLNYYNINYNSASINQNNFNNLNEKFIYSSWSYMLKNNSLSIEKVKWLTKTFYLKKIKFTDNSNLFYYVKNKNISLLDNDKLDETFVSSDNYRLQNTKFPIKINKGIINKNNISLLSKTTNTTKNTLFNYKINKSNIADKQNHIEQFWGFRQKRYKKLRSYSFSQNNKYTSNNYLYINDFVSNNNFNKYHLYTAIKNNKYKNEMIPTTLAKRLLRTKRTLILPVHINITLITNSYDVVHSWFVPGLGLKIDCVPGRSTHHSLYIDNVGFYYGQCAEICGRYHHHMPIRVCAIPFEHFILWWQTKGLPRIYRSSKLNNSILLDKFKS